MRHYEADIVCAYRFDRTGEGYVRVVYSTIYNLLVRVLFGIRMRDINFAFKLLPPAGAATTIDAGQRGLVHRRRAGRPGHSSWASTSSSSASTTSPAPAACRP